MLPLFKGTALLQWLRLQLIVAAQCFTCAHIAVVCNRRCGTTRAAPTRATPRAAPASAASWSRSQRCVRTSPRLHKVQGLQHRPCCRGRGVATPAALDCFPCLLFSQPPWRQRRAALLHAHRCPPLRRESVETQTPVYMDASNKLLCGNGGRESWGPGAVRSKGAGWAQPPNRWLVPAQPPALLHARAAGFRRAPGVRSSLQTTHRRHYTASKRRINPSETRDLSNPPAMSAALSAWGQPHLLGTVSYLINDVSGGGRSRARPRVAVHSAGAAPSRQPPCSIRCLAAPAAAPGCKLTQQHTRPPSTEPGAARAPPGGPTAAAQLQGDLGRGAPHRRALPGPRARGEPAAPGCVAP